jgi:hypothetical protein
MGKIRTQIIFQKDYFEGQIINGNLPTLGIFPPGPPELMFWSKLGEPIMVNVSHDYNILISRYKSGHISIGPTSSVYPVFSTIISLDYNTGRLYTGLTDIPYLQDNFLKRHFLYESQRQKVKKILFNQITQRFGFFQNVREEPYVSGDTLLCYTATLSSDDITELPPAKAGGFFCD